MNISVKSAIVGAVLGPPLIWILVIYPIWPFSLIITFAMMRNISFYDVLLPLSIPIGAVLGYVIAKIYTTAYKKE